MSATLSSAILPLDGVPATALVALNNAHAAELCFLTPERFAALIGQAFLACRIGVSPDTRGRGLARSLCRHLFERAAAAGHDRVVREVNPNPPNPASDAFHAAPGFAEIGSALLPNGKTVRYFSRGLK